MLSEQIEIRGGHELPAIFIFILINSFRIVPEQITAAQFFRLCKNKLEICSGDSEKMHSPVFISRKDAEALRKGAGKQIGDLFWGLGKNAFPRFYLSQRR